MLAARSRREAKQGLRRGAGVAVHREQEATERVYRTRGIPGRRRSRAVVRPSTRASHPSRAGCGYSGFLPFTVRLSRLAPAFDRREENHSHRQPAAQRVPIARPMATWMQKTFRLKDMRCGVARRRERTCALRRGAARGDELLAARNCAFRCNAELGAQSDAVSEPCWRRKS
jgi:hypothetical protein